MRDGEKKADFVNCVVWGKLAENLANYQDKGSLIGVIGSLRVDSYDKSDGTRGYKTYVLVNEVEFLGTKKNNTPVEKTDAEVLKDVIEEKDPYAEFGEQIQISDDELPF